MSALSPGSSAPPVPGVDFAAGPAVLFFYKVTCPVCQMAAPMVGEFQRAYPGRIVGVGQDAEGKLAEFDRELGMGFGSMADLPPYELSNGYQIGVVPSLFLVSPEGIVLESVESWNRDGFNQVSKHLAALTGAEYAPISEPSDGLPPFRPG